MQRKLFALVWLLEAQFKKANIWNNSHGLKKTLAAVALSKVHFCAGTGSERLVFHNSFLFDKNKITIFKVDFLSWKMLNYS